MFSFRRAVTILILGLASLVVQNILKYYLVSYSFLVPNFLISIVVYLGFYEVSPLGAVVVFLLGLEFDLASGTLFGPWAGSFIVIYGLFSALSQRIFIDSTLSALFAIFSSSIVSNILYYLVAYQVSASEFRPPWDVAIEATTTALASPLVFAVLKRIVKRRGRGGREFQR